MRYVTCNYCGADDHALVNRGPDLLLNRDGEFSLVRCRRCGLIYQNPQLTLEELPAHYPENYQPYQEEVAARQLAQRLSAQHGLNRRCNQLLQYAPAAGRLLDVGCATGLFLNAMQERGWQVAGVELSEHAAAYARQTFGLEVTRGTLEQARFATDSFDVVTMWDVLEHVIDPRATLQEVARLLRPGGLLALSLPNPAALEARLFGGSWVGWDRPRHLHLFPPALLGDYLRESGFARHKIDSLGGRWGLTLLSLEMHLNGRGMSPQTWQRWYPVLYNWPLRALTWPLYRVLEMANRTTVMNVFAYLPEGSA